MERARLGDFDEVNSSVELLGYASPPLASGEAPQAGTDSLFSTALDGRCDSGGAQSQPQPVQQQQQQQQSAAAAQRSASPGGASLAATFGSAGSEGMLAGLDSPRRAAAGGPATAPDQSLGRAAGGFSRAEHRGEGASTAQGGPVSQRKEDLPAPGNDKATAQAAAASMPSWSSDERSQAAVQAAIDLHGKLVVATGLPQGDERKPLWLAAIAIKATQTGIDAVQGANLPAPLCNFQSYVPEKTLCAWQSWTCSMPCPVVHKRQ